MEGKLQLQYITLMGLIYHRPSGENFSSSACGHVEGV